MIVIQRSVQIAFKDLLESEAINVEKLKQFIQKNSIVAELKPFCWKIILGIFIKQISESFDKKYLIFCSFQVSNLPIV